MRSKAGPTGGSDRAVWKEKRSQVFRHRGSKAAKVAPDEAEEEEEEKEGGRESD